MAAATERCGADFDKYRGFLKEGKSRFEIEAILRQDSLSSDEINEFWQYMASQALDDAIAAPPNDIAAIWKLLGPYQYFQRGFRLPSVPARKQPGDLRVVFLSDTHSLHDDLPPIPDGDILVHGGDFTDTGDRDEVLAFNAFLGTLPHRYKIVIGGNHECTFDKPYYKTHWKRYGHPFEYDSDDVRSLITNALYLEDALVSVEGYRIFGSPWQPEFCEWAFNLPRGSDVLRAKWTAVPSDIDILLTHSPPFGRGDDVGIVHVGDVHLLEQVQRRIKPAFHLFGHVHEGYGASYDGTTIFINGSNCTEEYKAINPIVVFDLPPRTATAVDDATDYHTLLAAQQHVANHAIKRFGIKGTSADQLFEETLRVRPVMSPEMRAMKYCFREAIQAADPSVKPPQSVPNYSIMTSGSALSRRITMSVLPQENTAAPASSPEKINRRRLGQKRAGLSVLPEENEDDRGAQAQAQAPAAPECVLCKLKVPGHIHPNAAPPSVPEQKQEEECLLCKFNVQGHVHPGRVVAAPEPECALCKYNVSGHIHRGREPSPPPPPAPASVPTPPEDDDEDGTKLNIRRTSSWF
ncbi:unnamed protein product [Aphanomyces euteiches]|uniref:Calcineurin-like phosphoesterase domain-containing protein n=1 Tax=Aphanomyces euteiches TaxID=100861 RepID=A0A6G0WZ87_9STRA|nr:hypothetical protein Ae201684_010230 [Aphanomyces euteiches]KAH9076088.1 hypothetical protein Ae201684P_012578 [Aphanomyces euteiches]KAH9151660.1 hypothetical protein AeRB84_005771 [Aphanomyces euteiches]